MNRMRTDFGAVVVYGNFQVYQLWTDPVTSPTDQPGQSQLAERLYCESSGFVAPGNIDSDNLFRGLSVGYTPLVIPPQATVMFKVACTLYYGHSSGEVHCLFRDGGREVMENDAAGRGDIERVEAGGHRDPHAGGSIQDILWEAGAFGTKMSSATDENRKGRNTHG